MSPRPNRPGTIAILGLALGTAFAAAVPPPAGAAGGAPGAAVPAAPVQAVDPATLEAAITLPGVMRHLEELQQIASANGDTRASGTPGYDASSAYVHGLLDAAGYDVTYQDVSYTVIDSEFRQVSPNATTYTLMGTYNLATASGFGDVAAPVVPVDVNNNPPPTPNGNTSGCEAADFAGFPVGSVALLQRGSCDFGVKAQNAQAAGATAVILYNEGTPGDASRNNVLNPTVAGYAVTIPVVGTSYELGRDLMDPAGTVVKIRVAQRVETTRNVIAETPTGNSDNVVMLGAFLGSDVDSPGINGNGTGAAALLEVALQLAAGQGEDPLNNKVRFAWWAGDEAVRQGSATYVNSLSPADLERIALYLDFDRVGSPNYFRGVLDASWGPAAGSQALHDLFDTYFTAKSLPHEDTSSSGVLDGSLFGTHGIAVGGISTGTTTPKSADQVTLYGGVAGVPFDPCDREPCDSLTPVADGAPAATYTALEAAYGADLVGNVNTHALLTSARAIAHAAATLAGSTLPVNGVESLTASITGTPQVGHTLTAATSFDDGPEVSTLDYRWQVGSGGAFTDLPGATGPSLLLTPDLADKAVRVVVTTSRPGYTGASATDTAIVAKGDIFLAVPTINGTPKVGEELSVAPPSSLPPGATVDYQWLRQTGSGPMVRIPDANGSTYRVRPEDVGARLRVRVTVTASGYNTASATSEPTPPVLPGTITGFDATVTGTERVGHTLTASTSFDDDPAYTTAFRWQVERDGNFVDIPGATDASLVLTPDLAGARVRLVAVASRSGYDPASDEVTTGPIALGDAPEAPEPTISGTAQVGHTLTAAADTEPGVEVQWQWQRVAGDAEPVDIPGATGPTYAVTAADVGPRLRVVLTVRGPGSEPGTSSASTAPVVPGTIPLGELQIRGRSVENRLLRVRLDPPLGPNAIDGLVMAYEWTADGKQLSSDDDRLRLGPAHVGKRVTVTVTASAPGYEPASRSATVGPVRRGRYLRVPDSVEPGQRFRVVARGPGRARTYTLDVGDRAVSGKVRDGGLVVRRLTLPESTRCGSTRVRIQLLDGRGKAVFTRATTIDVVGC